jgi:multicomponent Na+:H+ antiporter subunit D
MLELVAVAGRARRARRRRGTLTAGTRYFFAEFAASATFLLGVALLWREAGTVVLSGLPDGGRRDPGGRVAWPHDRRPAAEGAAVPPALLAARRPLARPEHGEPDPVGGGGEDRVRRGHPAVVRRHARRRDPGAAQLLGALGTAAIVWGSVNALRAGGEAAHRALDGRPARLHVPAAARWLRPGAWGGWSGGIVQAVAHALAKAAALMAAAVIVRGGPAGPSPTWAAPPPAGRIATFAFGVAGLSLVGLPPSGGFVAKWYLLLASFQTGQWWWAPVIVVGSLLTAAYLMRVIKRAFAPPPRTGELATRCATASRGHRAAAGAGSARPGLASHRAARAPRGRRPVGGPGGG